MNIIFIDIINNSITASYIILIVLLLRLFLKRYPKKFSYMLWIIVFIRLLNPLVIESEFSFFPENPQIISQQIIESTYDQVSNISENIIGSDEKITFGNESYSHNTPNYILTAGMFWLAGIILLSIYNFYATYKLRRILKGALHVENNIYESNSINTAFVKGIFKPKIYLPSNLEENEKTYVLEHERVHIKRGDNIFKLFAFLGLIVHWFNPLVWIAFVLMSKDMEMACDESVIDSMGTSIKKSYATSLLNSAGEQNLVIVSSLAFGDNGVEHRIKNILNYRKPLFLKSLILLIVSLIIILGFLFNPKPNIVEKSQAEILMEYKTPYVGDASSVGNIIYNLTFPEDIAYGYFELQTQKTPYGLTVYFDADKDSILKYMAKDKVDENILKHEAYLLFSLIENLDTVTFNIQYLDEMSVFEFDRQACEIELNRNINEFSRDAMELEKLIKLTLE